jgi:murein DD-endopeptidase MepM/ murein hydrolase activator NlpD
LSALSFVLPGLVASSQPAAASAGTDQTDIAHLEQQIAAQGGRAQALVSRYDEVQARLDALDAQIARSERLVAADQSAEKKAASALEAVAVKAYISGSALDSPAVAMLSGRWSASAALERNEYLGVVNAKMDGVLNALKVDQADTRDAQGGLRSEQSQATKTLHDLASAHDAATAAIASDEASLARVRGNLRSVLAAANARHRVEQIAAEQRLAVPAPAAHTAVLLPPSSAPPSTTVSLPAATVLPATTVPPAATSPIPVPPSSANGYANPLRDVVALSAERIDQGVDYSGFGPIYAIGNGVVLSTGGSGWPGGTFIAYRLTDGPASGLVVFAAEDIEPSVQVGATVTSGTVLGDVYAGPDGIETGWADGSALPNTMARTYGQFDGSNSSAFGYNFSELLQRLGAPAGIPSGPPNGGLPAWWPGW